MDNNPVETRVTLRDYIDLRLDSVKELMKSEFKGLALHLDGVEKASVLRASTLETRLEGMNAFREALKDQAKGFVVRAELPDVSAFISRSELLAALMAVVAILGCMIAILHFWRV